MSVLEMRQLAWRRDPNCIHCGRLIDDLSAAAIVCQPQKAQRLAHVLCFPSAVIRFNKTFNRKSAHQRAEA